MVDEVKPDNLAPIGSPEHKAWLDQQSEMKSQVDGLQQGLAEIMTKMSKMKEQKGPSIRDRMFQILRADFLEVQKDKSLAPLLQERIVFAFELGLLSPAEHEQMLKLLNRSKD